MKEHIYSLLVSERRRIGLSQQELAVRAGLRREKVNRVESKGEDISVAELSRLLDALGLELTVVEKGAAPVSSSAISGAPRSRSERHLLPREFDRASFIDGAKARILRWGKVPR